MTVITIDFEASCLPRHGLSYPIEVGIARKGQARSWLIRPHDDWAGWHWSAEAEALHGLSRDRVEREGLPVETVLAELADTDEMSLIEVHGKEELQKRLTKAMNEVLEEREGFGGVENVYFRSFIVQ